MGNLPFLDIILFAILAGFLVLRLRAELGKRSGEEEDQKPYGGRFGQKEDERDEDNVIELPGRGRDWDDQIAPDAEATPLQAGLSDIAAHDPNFSPEGFIGGAKGAFEIILKGFSDGDESALRPLLSDDVFANFADAIRERKEAGETMETELISVKDIDILDAGMAGANANVTIKIVSEQVNVVRDAEGEIVDGDPNYIDTVTDIWTFSRNTRSRDPNWALVATESPDEDDGETADGRE